MTTSVRSSKFTFQLRKEGFCHIDALDPSKAMLAVAKKDDLYENYIYEFITDKQLPIESGKSYRQFKAGKLFSEFLVKQFS